MNLNPNISSSQRTTAFVLYGTLTAASCLGILLILYDGIFHSIWLEGRTWIIALLLLYILLAVIMLHKGYEQTVNYMLIIFYMFAAFFTLLFWGLNAPVGILTMSFAVLLPSILISARSILLVTAIAAVMLITVETLHNFKVVSPDLQNLSLESTMWDVTAYSTILFIFALVSWLAGTQREKNLGRALSAEAELRAQKDLLALELDRESSALRLAQLNQIRHLHKFALLGQTTAATLHDLSNHLSVLNLDIDDIGQQVSNSKAIKNAKVSIEHINKMVIQARRQLNSYDSLELFNIVGICDQSIKDVGQKFKKSSVSFIKDVSGHKSSFQIKGNPVALTQIVTILLNNACEASCQNPSPQVTLSLEHSNSEIQISVMDNGPGISTKAAKLLFTPTMSSKPNGLGVGLYIAKHLAAEQFNGSVSALPSNGGAHFVLTIPKAKHLRGNHLKP